MSDFIGFLKSNARWVGGGFLLTLLSGFGQTFFISLFAPEIKETFGLTNGSWGWVYMIATLGSAITLVQLGRVIDNYSIAMCSAAIMIALAVATFSMSVIGGHIIWLVLVIYALRLFGQGMMTHAAMTGMGRWYEANRGRAVSIATLGHQGSELLFPLAFLAIASAFGWQMSWVLSGVILLLSTPLVYLMLRTERDPIAMKDPSTETVGRKQWQRTEVIRDRAFIPLMMGLLAPPFIGTSIFFHQAYLMELKDLPREVFAASISIMAIVTVIFALVAGWMIDRFTAVRVARYFLLPLGIGCTILALGSGTSAVVGFMIFQGISYGFASTLTGAILPEVYGIKYLGSIRALVVAMMVFFTAAGPGLTGTLIDMGISFETQLLFMAGYLVFATFILVAVSRHFIARLAYDGAKV